MDNVEASVAILRKITEEWKEFSGKQSSLDALKEALKSFRNKVLALSLKVSSSPTSTTIHILIKFQRAAHLFM